jgi:hypothetical protein
MFRFTIRDVLWLTTITALAVAWYLHWRDFSSDNTKLRNQVSSLSQDRIVAYQAAVDIQKRADEWQRYAEEERRRADFVSDQLYDRNRLTQSCPKCGETVSFPRMSGKPWVPPDGSLWPDAKPKQPAY